MFILLIAKMKEEATLLPSASRCTEASQPIETRSFLDPRKAPQWKSPVVAAVFRPGVVAWRVRVILTFSHNENDMYNMFLNYRVGEVVFPQLDFAIVTLKGGRVALRCGCHGDRSFGR